MIIAHPIISLLIFGLILSCSGCSKAMKEQPRHGPLEPSDFFRDGQSARPRIEGTIARELLKADRLFYAGEERGAPSTVFPFPITEEILARGQERFDIFCSVCHDRTGNGRGIIVQRGYPRPQPFHSARLRNAPPGYFFQNMTNGYKRMPSYAAQVPAEDRWAIASYIRALQLSQSAVYSELPARDRQHFK